MIEFDLHLTSKERFDLHMSLAQCLSSLETTIGLFEDMQKSNLGDWNNKLAELRYQKLATQKLIDKVMQLYKYCTIIPDEVEKEIVKYEVMGN